jgi:hypothetical protein
MPTMADIIVKKADTTTDITYSAINPSGGDGTWAFWRAAVTAAIQKAKATFGFMSKWNNAKDVRRLQGTFLYPYVVLDTTTGVTSVMKYISFDYTWQVPQDFPVGDMSEAAAQGSNLAASTLIKSCVASGFAPQ